jgi:hypothetical protein
MVLSDGPFHFWTYDPDEPYIMESLVRWIMNFMIGNREIVYLSEHIGQPCLVNILPFKSQNYEEEQCKQ